jgi:hypothetical protein
MTGAVIKILAKNPPSILIAGGVILLLAGKNNGMDLVYLGVILQIIWLVLKFK